MGRERERKGENLLAFSAYHVNAAHLPAVVAVVDPSTSLIEPIEWTQLFGLCSMSLSNRLSALLATSEC